MNTLEHHCKHGGTSTITRDAESFGIPVWRCSGLCGTFFAVVDGELDQVAPEPELADWELELLLAAEAQAEADALSGSSDPAGTTETS